MTAARFDSWDRDQRAWEPPHPPVPQMAGRSRRDERCHDWTARTGKPLVAVPTRASEAAGAAGSTGSHVRRQPAGHGCSGAPRRRTSQAAPARPDGPGARGPCPASMKALALTARVYRIDVRVRSVLDN
jgi:hypothetical protein